MQHLSFEFLNGEKLNSFTSECSQVLTLELALMSVSMTLSYCFFIREVYNFPKFTDEAVKTFKEHSAAMHPVTAMLVSKDLKIT